jgi:two-component system, LytTR family, sensor kinase
MKKSDRQLIIRTISIYLAWLMLDFFFSYSRGDYSSGTKRYQITDVLPVTVCYAWIVFHNLVLFKNLLLNRKQYFLYVVAFIPSLYLFSAIYNWIVPATQFDRSLTYMVVYNLFIALMGTAFFLSWNYFIEKKNSLILNSINKEFQLKQLKSQLNPHFLFNSLNNIYSYNLENSKHGNDLILKLSNLMRFMVETSDKDAITLSDEMEFIENYITFESERLGHRCEIVFDKEIDRLTLMIPPLMLFPFIENAFKHGTATLRKSKIEISIAVQNCNLELHVKNSIQHNGAISTKTGLSNIQKRLELLFPESHLLNVKKDSETFIVSLNITLNEN